MASPLPTFFKDAFKLEVSVNGHHYNTFTLPLVDGGTYDLVVNWGDGTSNHITTWDDSNKSHIYSSLSGDDPVSMIVSLTGICTKLSFYDGDSTRERLVKLIDVKDLGFTNLDFNGCVNLTTISSNLNKLTHLITAFRMFNDCEALIEIPAGIFDGSIGILSFSTAFTSCYALTTIPAHLFDNNINVINMDYVFSDCPLITAIPENLFQYNTEVTSYSFAFSQDIELIGNAPTLWLLVPEPNGLHCFTDCTGLTNYSSIPDDWKGIE